MNPFAQFCKIRAGAGRTEFEFWVSTVDGYEATLSLKIPHADMTKPAAALRRSISSLFKLAEEDLGYEI